MSVYGDILLAVESVVGDLGLDDLPPTSIKVRKVAVYLAEHDPVPLLCISPNLDSLDQLTFDNHGFFPYEVRLTLYRETGIEWEDLAWRLDTRHALHRALFKTTLTGAATVFDVAWQPNPVYDVGALAAGVDVSRMAFVYTSSEARSI